MKIKTINKNYKNFITKGWFDFGDVLDKKKCSNLKKHIKKIRPLKETIFYRNKKKFLKNGRYEKYAPGSINHNLLIDKKINLDFIEKSKNFQKYISKIMGTNYKIIKKTVIRSVPTKILPNWIKKEAEYLGRPNLNPWIKDEFQDIQYFLNADFHQDMTRSKKFCTFYIYLDVVNKSNSPLRILENSHTLGITPYPHYVRQSESIINKNDKNVWFYSNFLGDHIKCEERLLKGGVGRLVCFHGLCLHGTYYNFSSNPRISLRYLIESNKKSFKKTIFGKSFKNIKGLVSTKNINPRLDRNKDGSYKKTGMSIRY